MQPPRELIAHLDFDACGAPIGYSEAAAAAYPDETAVSLLLAATQVMATAYKREKPFDARGVRTLAELKAQDADIANRSLFSPEGSARMLRLLTFVLNRELDYSPEARPHRSIAADDALPDLHAQIHRLAGATAGLYRRAAQSGLSGFGTAAALVHATVLVALEDGVEAQELATLLAEALTRVAIIPPIQSSTDITSGS